MLDIKAFNVLNYAWLIQPVLILQERGYNIMLQRIREERRRQDMTQADLAIASGVSRATIAQLESGDHSNVTLNTLSSLADALGVSVAYLVG